MEEQKDFYTECGVCKQHLLNHVGSTPCCGSIAYRVNEDGTTSNKFMIFGSVNGGDIEKLEITNKIK